MQLTREDRAQDISEYLGVPYEEALHRLSQGFHYNHALVAEDFRAANTNVDDPDSLLNWYRNTDAYIWELSAYHLEEGFNYSGMCEGIGQYLHAIENKRVLVLGDGVGDLSLHLRSTGLDATYHDLKDSKTAGFARYVSAKTLGEETPIILTGGWAPVPKLLKFDAVVALDFFEHLVNVEEWARRVYELLNDRGVFLAQNAFGIGDAEHGDSIPMHLSVNNKFIEGWDPLMTEIGFTRLDSGWYQK